jgi:hypothetical protein
MKKGDVMGKLAKLLRSWSDAMENKTNEMRRKHGLPEDHRPSEYRKKKYAEKGIRDDHRP